mmetsp:Transcript_96339/g.215797  ORF Transcript_96339/g.215797 Transcript_96339/m.215797 type:complete len:237 (+) Transcript_96339:171-881(+)
MLNPSRTGGQRSWRMCESCMSSCGGTARASRRTTRCSWICCRRSSDDWPARCLKRRASSSSVVPLWCRECRRRRWQRTLLGRQAARDQPRRRRRRRPAHPSLRPSNRSRWMSLAPWVLTWRLLPRSRWMPCAASSLMHPSQQRGSPTSAQAWTWPKRTTPSKRRQHGRRRRSPTSHLHRSPSRRRPRTPSRSTLRSWQTQAARRLGGVPGPSASRRLLAAESCSRSSGRRRLVLTR